MHAVIISPILINLHIASPYLILQFKTTFMILFQTEIQDNNRRICSAVDYCFLTPDGKRFRVALPYRPYFYVATREDGDRELREASAAIQRRFGHRVAAIEQVKKNDLDAV